MRFRHLQNGLLNHLKVRGMHPLLALGGFPGQVRRARGVDRYPGLRLHTGEIVECAGWAGARAAGRQGQAQAPCRVDTVLSAQPCPHLLPPPAQPCTPHRIPSPLPGALTALRSEDPAHLVFSKAFLELPAGVLPQMEFASPLGCVLGHFIGIPELPAVPFLSRGPQGQWPGLSFS